MCVCVCARSARRQNGCFMDERKMRGRKSFISEMLINKELLGCVNGLGFFFGERHI